MKKFIIIAVFLFATGLMAQHKVDAGNSSSSGLDSAAVFTGTTADVSLYNTAYVSVRSDSAGTLNVLWGRITPITRANAVVCLPYSYTGGDSTFVKTLPVIAPYLQVIYSNAGDSVGVQILTRLIR